MAKPEILDNTTYRFSSQVHTLYDPTHSALWVKTNPTPRPCYTPVLLEDLLAACRRIELDGNIVADGLAIPPAKYVITASDRPTVFMLGGDLALFATAVERGNRDELLRYGRICVDLIHSLYHNYFQPVTTLALVQGECLGGGFESVLAHDVIIAEQQARFGFPEIRFNLFPGMGAFSLLERRIGRVAAMRLLESGEIYSAAEMHTLGLVDRVVSDGEGEIEVRRFLHHRQACSNGMEALARVRRRVQPLDYAELLEIVDIWADAALRLAPRDLKMMRRFAQRQIHL